jgi:hypothetical protein
MSQNPFDMLERRLAFQALCRYFLESMNPRLEKEVVVLNCILDFDEYQETFTAMRYTAYDFVRSAEMIIDKGLSDNGEFAEWITRWNMTYGIE